MRCSAAGFQPSASSALAVLKQEAGKVNITQMSALLASEESKGPAWLQRRHLQNLVRLHFVTWASVRYPFQHYPPKVGLQRLERATVRATQSDRRKIKGGSVLLWGYLPTYAGWVRVDFPYLTSASVRGGGLFLHVSCSWKGTDTASTRFLFNALRPSVPLFIMCDWRLRDVLPKWLWQSFFLGGLEIGATSKPRIWGSMEEGKESKNNAAFFFFSCQLLSYTYGEFQKAGSGQLEAFFLRHLV